MNDLSRIFLFTLLLLDAPMGRLFAQENEAATLLEQGTTSGGLVVHVGCGEGRLTGELARARSALLVHGLDSDAVRVRLAREHFLTLEEAGRLSAELWKGGPLPYAERLVNLLLIDAGQEVPEEEAFRVLAPGGTILRRAGDQWKATRKPPPSPKGDWTHYQYNAANNPVGKDPDCGLPRRFQWSGKPLWSAAHESMASLNAMVSANGRVFYIIDEGPRASVQLPSDWELVARDACNGVVLWKRPLQQWLTRFWPWKSGPAQMPRKLIAIGDRVYAPLDLNGPLLQFDAASGAILRTYEGSGAAEEVIHSDGVLLVQVNPDPDNLAEIEEEREKRRHFSYDGRNRVVLDHDKAKRVVALDPDSGKTLWTHVGPRLLPLTLSALNGNVLYHDGERMVCLDVKTGAEKWKSEPVAAQLKMYSEESPTLVLSDGAAFFTWNKKMTAVSMADGHTLWTSPWTEGDYRSPVTAMLMDELLWSMNITSARAPGTFTGRDQLTGEIRKQFDLPPFQGIGHHRCYKAKASGDFVLLSRSGVEYVNPVSQDYHGNHWIRGACLYGILPANGMLYATPHACACYIKGKLNGFTALVPGPTGPSLPPDPSLSPHEKGPSYGAPVDTSGSTEDWPTYRHDVGRSGHGSTKVPSTLRETWKAALGGDLSSVTVGEELVLVAQRDRNTILALHTEDGTAAWHYVAGGTVDSPPTLDGGHVYFGAGDGSIYCLRAADGALAWRTRAATAERRVVSFGRVESSWPVHGSVLVQGSVVYCAAGRSSFLDGGITMVRIDALSGKILGSYTAYDLDSDGKEPPLQGSFDMDGALTDILSGDGSRVFMRHLGFDKETLSPAGPAPHLYSPTGYLDDNWWHRTYWVYGEDTKGGYGGWWQAGNKLPAGRLLVFDDEAVYGFGRNFYAGINSAQFGRGEKYVLSASGKASGPEPDYTEIQKASRRGEYLKADWAGARTTPVKWEEEISFHVRAMVLSGGTLFAAGPYGDAVRSMESFSGQRGSRLAAASVADGKVVANWRIDGLPVFDGLAAARGHLYLAFQDGTLRCYGPEGKVLESALGEPIEVLPETLEPDDEAYRRETREKLGLPPEGKPGAAAPVGKEKLKGASLEEKFSSVEGGRVVSSDLGYRLGAAEDGVALAVRALSVPVTTTARWKISMRACAGFPNPPWYQNGFLVFGDGPEDTSLVKCGFQFVQGMARILEGPTAQQKGAKVKVAGAKDHVIELDVEVDLSKQVVIIHADGQTLASPLKRTIGSVTHVGFGVWNAVTDFSAIEPGGG
ncbi:MAG: PQQ-binding-like beta-propeller repeat protein [Verrucomicrobiales bacterium]|nr:PQQ-binding-like beta-propeller repeat protein [Verrucomicrobiales bacterium]